MYCKENIDNEAIREAKALKQQGYSENQQHNRQRKSQEYNKMLFDKLFKG